MALMPDCMVWFAAYMSALSNEMKNVGKWSGLIPVTVRNSRFYIHYKIS